jgi:enamine deaminase RidA (YjgF/YER057c/UK114 family)
MVRVRRSGMCSFHQADELTLQLTHAAHTPKIEWRRIVIKLKRPQRMREIYTDGTELRTGYCRALRTGNHIFVSGTGPLDSNGNVVGETVGEQARYVYQKIEKSLAHFGADLSNLVRILIFLKNVDDFEAFNAVHVEIFAKYRPTSDLVFVADLIKGASVQIEAQAVIDG